MEKITKPFVKTFVSALLTMSSYTAVADAEDVRENLNKLNLPAGFNIDIYAEVPGARQMTLGTTGTVYVGTRDNNVYAVVDKNKDYKAEDVVTMMDDMKVPNGVTMHDGFLYVAEQHRITRYAAPDFDLKLPFKQMREVIYEGLPDKFHHGWRYITVGPDEKLYVTVGAACNICDAEGIEATIIRLNTDGSEVETFAEGIRNSVGMDFQPKTGALYFTDNGVDMMGDDKPSGELNAASKAGMHFGFPFYAGGDDRHKDWQDKKAPKNVTFPELELQAHSANLGFKFYTGQQFPSEYQHDAIIAQHGSWNRNDPVGYQLIRVKFDQNNKVSGHEVFIDGWLNDGQMWGRPTDVLQMPDGSLLVSDDYNGVIYRISYGENNVTQVDNGSLTMPESVISHPDGRVFITEIGGFGQNGDGKVTQINQDGSYQTLVASLNDPKGMDLFDNHLIVADIDQVLRINLSGETTVIADAKDFPTKAVFLNDVEIDGNGNIYVSDSGDDDGNHGAIYKISTDGKITEIFGEHNGIKRPNGLLMDGPNKLLVADFGTGDLFQLTLADNAQLTHLNSGFGGADGLVRDSDGLLYISDWKNGKVWQLTDAKATPQLITEGHKSAADIALSVDGKSILMPDMKAGQLIPLPIK